MPDLLSHVLLAYVLFRVAGWRYTWLTIPYVVVGMAGALLPDLAKITLLVRPYELSADLGIPFSWLPLHRLGGVLVSAGILSLFVKRDQRQVVFALLLSGACTHLLLDAFLARPGPETYDLLYPLTDWMAPVLGIDLYHSFDQWPAAVSATVAVVVAGVTQILNGSETAAVDQ